VSALASGQSASGQKASRQSAAPGRLESSKPAAFCPAVAAPAAALENSLDNKARHRPQAGAYALQRPEPLKAAFLTARL